MRRFGVARATSPDAHSGHPALRLLGGNLASAILAALGFLRRLGGTGNPSRTVRQSACYPDRVFEAAEPGELALGELACAGLGAFDGGGAGEAALDEVDRLGVAGRLAGGGADAGGMQGGLGLFKNAAGKHGFDAAVDAVGEDPSREIDDKHLPGEGG